MTRRYTDSDLAKLAGSLTATLPPPVRKKRNNEESLSQRDVIKWWAVTHRMFEIPECLLYSIPNGGGRSGPRVGAILKKEGLRPGVCDLFLSVPRNRIPGLYIEMKTAIGVVSPEQKEFMAYASARGYSVSVCRSSNEAIQVISDYLT